jgi:hypothetical protein
MNANANRIPAAVANGNVPSPEKAAKAAKGKARGGNVKPGTPVIAAKKSKPATWITDGNALIKEHGKVFVLADMKAMNNADADKAINQIRKSGSALKTMAHKAACGILLHYVQHGDYTKLEGLLSAVMAGMSRRMANGLVDWVKAFSSLTYNVDTLKFQHPKGANRYFHLTGDATAKEGTPHSKGALNLPFYGTGYGDAPEPHKFNAEDYIAEAIQRIVKKLEAEFAKKNAETTSAREAKRIKVERDHIKALEGVAKTLHIKLETAAPAGNA